MSVHETKFVLRSRAGKVVDRLLRWTFAPDPEHAAAVVSSIYFDTRDWRLLEEKINSDRFKCKVRIRWYSDFATGVPGGQSFLEVKSKDGRVRTKARWPFDVGGETLSRTRLEGCELLHVNRLLRSKGIALPGTLFPTIQISFRRLRFVEPASGARLCLDSEIRAARTSRSMLPRSDPSPLDLAILECKTDPGKSPVTLPSAVLDRCRKQSISKYLSCYLRIAHGAT